MSFNDATLLLRDVGLPGFLFLGFLYFIFRYNNATIAFQQVLLRHFARQAEISHKLTVIVQKLTYVTRQFENEAIK
ncbi:MAG: hypothetical protein D6712_11640, partial [Chloroflexi bacterium]